MNHGSTDRIHHKRGEAAADVQSSGQGGRSGVRLGTSPTDPLTGLFKGTTIQEQTRQCLSTTRAILEAAGSSLDQLVSVTVVLPDDDDSSGMNEEWLDWFPCDPPARQAAKLPVRLAGLKVSISAIAEA